MVPSPAIVFRILPAVVSTSLISLMTKFGAFGLFSA